MKTRNRTFIFDDNHHEWLYGLGKRSDIVPKTPQYDLLWLSLEMTKGFVQNEPIKGFSHVEIDSMAEYLARVKFKAEDYRSFSAIVDEFSPDLGKKIKELLPYKQMLLFLQILQLRQRKFS